jgi:hypothetical protein
MTSLGVKLFLYGSVATGVFARGDAPWTSGPGTPDDRQPVRTFTAEVVRLAAQADAVDRAWAAYRADCPPRLLRAYDYGREWFAVWDRAVEPAAGPDCASKLGHVLEIGRRLRGDLETARHTASAGRVTPATIVGILRWHGLDWPEPSQGGQSAAHR